MEVGERLELVMRRVMGRMMGLSCIATVLRIFALFDVIL